MKRGERNSGINNRYSRVLSTLKQYYSDSASPTALGELSSLEDPFRVLIATVLSQRTRDEITSEVEEVLFRVYPDAASLARARVASVQKLIRRVGFYKTKARAIREIARQIDGRYGGKVPQDVDSLLTLPMVGRKTANCVIVYGFGKSAIPVDTHVHRVSNRLGWVKTGKPGDTETALSKILPVRDWLDLNELMVTHGKTICKPMKPRCGVCPVSAFCEYARGKSSS